MTLVIYNKRNYLQKFIIRLKINQSDSYKQVLVNKYTSSLQDLHSQEKKVSITFIRFSILEELIISYLFSFAIFLCSCLKRKKNSDPRFYATAERM